MSTRYLAGKKMCDDKEDFQKVAKVNQGIVWYDDQGIPVPHIIDGAEVFVRIRENKTITGFKTVTNADFTQIGESTEEDAERFRESFEQASEQVWQKVYNAFEEVYRPEDKFLYRLRLCAKSLLRKRFKNKNNG